MTTQEMKQCFGREFHGHGETQWIRDGKVVAFLEAYTPETEVLILNYFKRLLDGARALSKVLPGKQRVWKLLETRLG